MPEKQKAHVVDFSQVVLTVAPGEPDNPHTAKKFMLSWWEKNPPERYGKPTIKRFDGWCLIVRRLGVEGRLLAFKDPTHPALLMAMFGEQNYAYVHEEATQ